MTLQANSNHFEQSLVRRTKRFNTNFTTNWPPAYRTIDGSLSSIPGNLMGSFFISGPTICLPDASNDSIAD
jgi:hypothetical protein